MKKKKIVIFRSSEDTFSTLFLLGRLSAGTCKSSVSETYLTDFILFMARFTMTTILLKKIENTYILLNPY